VISGFTIVRNAVKLDYPIVPAIRSILDICDEVLVNVGKSDDDTRDLVESIGDPRVRILDSVWDLSLGGGTLAFETNRVMAACAGTWGVYIQADEVLHESGAALIREGVRQCDGDDRVEGLLVDYLHFYGDFDTIATNRHWYRREVRVVRLGRDVRSYEAAQGFRVGPRFRRVRARATAASMFHYGWSRSAASLGARIAEDEGIHHEMRDRLRARRARGSLDWTPLLRPFRGTHPRAARDWVAARRGTAAPVGPRRFKISNLRYYVSDWIERLTGVRVFEYRNYVVV